MQVVASEAVLDLSVVVVVVVVVVVAGLVVDDVDGDDAVAEVAADLIVED